MRRFLKVKAQRTKPEMMNRVSLIAALRKAGSPAVCAAWPEKTLVRKHKELIHGTS